MQEAAQSAPVKMIAMKLDRHYHPAGSFEVVGHTKPEVRRKNAAGVEVVVEAEEWIPDEPMPAAIAGTGFKDKFWAGTVLRLPVDEAKTVEKARIGVRSIED